MIDPLSPEPASPQPVSPQPASPQPADPGRREVLKQAALLSVTAAGFGGGLTLLTRRPAPAGTAPASELSGIPAPGTAAPGTAERIIQPTGPYDTHEAMTGYRDMTTYNNFYELGLGKDDPARHAGALVTRPWTVVVDGEVRKPVTLDLATLQRWFAPEDRIYRMRCVEGWSMVMPWLGFSLAALLRRLEPTGAAKYVQFTAINAPDKLPGQRPWVLDWPYTEGLRLDEALHPLTLLAVGLEGRALLPQNGAPLRLVVPWKYGFKSVKSIVRITLTRTQPPTTWALAAPDEYGFYANVNPEVPHPRWSQATEQRIGQGERQPTLPFNGYGEQVAGLYAGLDLRRNF